MTGATIGTTTTIADRTAIAINGDAGGALARFRFMLAAD